MSSVTKVVKTLKLDLTNIPINQRGKAKRDVADFLINETIRYIDRGDSPVNGEPKFPLLDKDYAKAEHNGNRTSRLQLDGDLLEAYKTWDVGGNLLEIGVKGTQAPKCDGHNQISIEAKQWAKTSEMPKRRFIPDADQTYKPAIMGKVKGILDEYRVEPKTYIFDVPEKVSSVIEEPKQVTLTVDSLFSNDVVETLFYEQLRKKREL